ncbi:unnamed protein product [Amoebophrya sp. A120]|nr:unnamed protein product [Amoebophrya sp. A120]|eukprot:GSA120T00014192001.1
MSWHQQQHYGSQWPPAMKGGQHQQPGGAGGPPPSAEAVAAAMQVLLQAQASSSGAGSNNNANASQNLLNAVQGLLPQQHHGGGPAAASSTLYAQQQLYPSQHQPGGATTSRMSAPPPVEKNGPYSNGRQKPKSYYTREQLLAHEDPILDQKATNRNFMQRQSLSASEIKIPSVGETLLSFRAGANNFTESYSHLLLNSNSVVQKAVASYGSSRANRFTNGRGLDTRRLEVMHFVFHLQKEYQWQLRNNCENKSHKVADNLDHLTLGFDDRGFISHEGQTTSKNVDQDLLNRRERQHLQSILRDQNDYDDVDEYDFETTGGATKGSLAEQLAANEMLNKNKTTTGTSNKRSRANTGMNNHNQQQNSTNASSSNNAKSRRKNSSADNSSENNESNDLEFLDETDEANLPLPPNWIEYEVDDNPNEVAILRKNVPTPELSCRFAATGRFVMRIPMRGISNRVLHFVMLSTGRVDGFVFHGCTC